MSNLRIKCIFLITNLFFLTFGCYTMEKEENSSYGKFPNSHQREALQAFFTFVSEKGEQYFEQFVDKKMICKSLKEFIFYKYYLRYQYSVTGDLCIRRNESPYRGNKYFMEILQLYELGLWHPSSKVDRNNIKEFLFEFRGGGRMSYCGLAAYCDPSLTQADVMPEREKIAILGGGYTGVMSAILLAKLKDSNNNPLYEVHLYEENSELMRGASLTPGRLHLGGEYPKDEMTALQCLRSAIIFRQMFQQVYTDIPTTAFLLSEKSEKSENAEERLSYDQMKAQYEIIKQAYKKYYLLLEGKYQNMTDEIFFGNPDNLYCEIPMEETPKGYKGILTQEKGLNPLYLGLTLEKLLKQHDVIINKNAKVERLSKVFNSNFNNGRPLPGYIVDGIYYQQVVNSTWVDFKPIEISATPIPDIENIDAKEHKEAITFVRGIMLADISKCHVPEFCGKKASIFGLLGNEGGMVSPFNDSIALLYLPSEDGAYIGEHPISGSIPSPLAPFKSRLKYYEQHKNERMENILSNLQEKYPFLQNAKPLDLIIRETIFI